MLGPSGPRRLRLAIEHLAQYRGGICFAIDLDPRYVVRCLKDRKIAEAQAYKDHCIEQAMTVLAGGHDIKCMFTTPKLLAAFDEALRAGKLEDKYRALNKPIPAGGLQLDQGGRDHRHLLGRHRVHPAVYPRGLRRNA